MFKVKSVSAGYQIYWASLDESPVPLAFEWDKIYTGSSGQSNAYRRCRQLNALAAIQRDLREVGADWWAGPYKTGNGNGKYYIYPNRDEPREEDLLGFSSLPLLAAWIRQRQKQLGLITPAGGVKSDKYVRVHEVVEIWMRQVVAGERNEKTRLFIEPSDYIWTVWSLAQAANSHFDFTPGAAESEIVNLAREVLGPDAPEGEPDEDEE